MVEQNRIKNFHIKNVKGIEDETFSFEPFLIPNKPNLFIAPNGYGKSSITTAFNSLLKTKLKLSPLEYREQNTKNKPYLSVTVSNQNGENEEEYFADENKNILSDKFDIEVINSPLKAKKKSLGDGNSYAVIDIEPLILWNTIPKKEILTYSITNYRTQIKYHSNIFKNLKDLFSDKKFICEFKNTIDYKKFNQKLKQRNVENFKNKLYKLLKSEIKGFSGIDIADLEIISEISDTANLIKKYWVNYENKKDLYIQALQVLEIISNLNSNSLNNIYKYYSYSLEKNKFQTIIKDFDNAWLKLDIKEKKGKLVAEFPNPTLISNGQRDILVFIAKLLKAEVKLHNDNSILIIDEIFDYLDEANLVAAQYYICKFIDNFKLKKKKLYVILMTHLDPVVFNSYCFKSHKKHLYYLTKSKRKPSNKIIEKLLIQRDKKISALSQETIDKIATYYLHFNPETIDFTNDFPDWLHLNEISTKDRFMEHITTHFNLYKNDNRNSEYDPLAVCIYIRLKIEENIYIKLPADKQEEYLKCHKTINKLDYANEANIEIPEKYYLLSLIHNEAIHCSENTDNYTRLYSKLENLTIRYLILSVT